DGSVEGDGGVSPALRRRLVPPLLADAQPADDGAPAIDDEELAVVASEERARPADGGWAEGVDVAPFVAQPCPEGAGGADRSDPVEEDADLDAGAGSLGEGVGEAAADAVVAEDVVLEVDAPLGARDPLEHGGEDGGSVDEEAGGVAIEERRLGG